MIKNISAIPYTGKPEIDNKSLFDALPVEKSEYFVYVDNSNVWLCAQQLVSSQINHVEGAPRLDKKGKRMPSQDPRVRINLWNLLHVATDGKYDPNENAKIPENLIDPESAILGSTVGSDQTVWDLMRSRKQLQVHTEKRDRYAGEKKIDTGLAARMAQIVKKKISNSTVVIVSSDADLIPGCRAVLERSQAKLNAIVWDYATTTNFTDWKALDAEAQSKYPNRFKLIRLKIEAHYSERLTASDYHDMKNDGKIDHKRFVFTNVNNWLGAMPDHTVILYSPTLKSRTIAGKYLDTLHRPYWKKININAAKSSLLYTLVWNLHEENETDYDVGTKVRNKILANASQFSVNPADLEVYFVIDRLPNHIWNDPSFIRICEMHTCPTCRRWKFCSCIEKKTRRAKAAK